MANVSLILGDLRQTGVLTNPGPTIPDGEGGFIQSRVPCAIPTWRFALQRASVSMSERIFGSVVIGHADYIFNGRFHPEIGFQTQITWVDLHGDSHVGNVLDVVDTEGAGVETVVLISELTST